MGKDVKYQRVFTKTITLITRIYNDNKSLEEEKLRRILMFMIWSMQIIV